MNNQSLLTPSACDLPATKEALGEHILAEISRCNGPQLPCYSTSQILGGFWDRYGADGMAICEQAFGKHNGMWRGAPITVLRFEGHQDPYFSVPLLAEARAAQGDRGGHA